MKEKTKLWVTIIFVTESGSSNKYKQEFLLGLVAIVTCGPSWTAREELTCSISQHCLKPAIVLEVHWCSEENIDWPPRQLGPQPRPGPSPDSLQSRDRPQPGVDLRGGAERLPVSCEEPKMVSHHKHKMVGLSLCSRSVWWWASRWGTS